MEVKLKADTDNFSKDMEEAKRLAKKIATPDENMLLIQDHTKAEPGDIFFTSNVGFFDWIIRTATANPVSHVGIILDVQRKSVVYKNGKKVNRDIWETIEALPPEVRIRTRRAEHGFFLDKKVYSKTHKVGIISLYRPKGGLDFNSKRWLLRQVGKTYDYYAVIRLGLVKLNNILPWIAKPLMKIFPWKTKRGWLMCSELVNFYLKLKAYRKLPAGYSDPPGDLERYCIRQLTGVEVG